MSVFEERSGWLKREGKACFELNAQTRGIQFENLRAAQTSLNGPLADKAKDSYLIYLPKLQSPLLLSQQAFGQETLLYKTGALNLSFDLGSEDAQALRMIFFEPCVFKRNRLAMRLKVNLLASPSIVNLNLTSEQTELILYSHFCRQLLHFAGDEAPWILTASDWSDHDRMSFDITGLKLELELPKGTGQTLIRSLSQTRF